MAIVTSVTTRFARRMLWLALLLAALPQAHAQEADEDAPAPYSPTEAMQFHLSPKAWMVDATTCERVSGVVRPDGRLTGAGSGVLLYRQDNPGRPFMKATTREDGVYVARFAARPGERVLSRAFVRDPRSGKTVYGRTTVVECSDNAVAVGDVSQVTPPAGDAGDTGEK